MTIPTKLNTGLFQLWTISLQTMATLTVPANTARIFLHQGNTTRNHTYWIFRGITLATRPGLDNFHSILVPDVPAADFKSYKYPALLKRKAQFV
jgi:hypothetical protein